MNSPKSHTQIKPLLIFAYGAFASGGILFISAFMLTLPAHFFKATLILAASFAAIGTGEFLNHPKQKLITQETIQNKSKPQYHHSRNPCSLGNLFDIGGLLLFFIAISSFFFPH